MSVFMFLLERPLLKFFQIFKKQEKGKKAVKLYP